MLSPCAEFSLIGYSVDDSILLDYDTLSLSEFKKVMNFLQATYREARNKKNLSGFHGDFGACVGGNVYLLYFHLCLNDTCDKALMECAYPELPADMK